MKKLTIILGLLCFIGSLVAQEKKDIKPLEIGASAPDFKLKSVDGNYYTLDNFKDKDILVVLFTCNHCPTAQAYEDKFIKLVNTYSESGVGFIAISPNSNEALSLSECSYSDMDDSYESMIIRAKEKEFSFPYLYDGDDHKYSLKYGPQATPHLFVFDKERKLKYRGRFDDTENPYIEAKTKDLENAIEAMLAGNDPEVAATKTFGCSVKWSWKNQWTEQLKKQWAEEEVNIADISVEEIESLMKNKSQNLRMINVWATWCGPCVMEFPDLVDIFRIYEGRNFEFVSLSADKMPNKDKVLQFLEKHDAAASNFIFKGENIYELIEAVDPDWQGTIPYTAIIKPGGEVIFKHSGAIDPLEVKKAIISYMGRYYADDQNEF